MRIAQIVPGLGDNFYCENCLRDAALVRAIRKRGHDVLMIPIYLPMQLDRDEPISDAPIFFGGINVYLQQKWAFFRKTPRCIDRMFDSPKLLGWVARKAGMTRARDLGETTVSMLRGEEGRQVKELERFVDWLDTQDNKPQVVCLSNILLAGLAKVIKARLGVPVLSLLQDEDGFLDGLGEPYAARAWEMLAERAADVDAFIAVSKYYADVMQLRLRIGSERVHVVYPGISLAGYEAPPVEPQIPTVGYLSRMCFDKGLDTLVDAFVKLRRNEKLKSARLLIAGGQTRRDKAFINRIRQQLNSHKLMDDVEFLLSFEHNSRLSFLRSLTLLSVPEKRPVAYGLYVLEALAAGVPVVEPAIGGLGELLEMTGGGVAYEPNNAETLAAAMQPLLLDRSYARQLGNRGRDAVFGKFNIDQTAAEIVRIYEETAR